jgi:hypothetical protein
MVPKGLTVAVASALLLMGDSRGSARGRRQRPRDPWVALRGDVEPRANDWLPHAGGA